MVNSYDYVTNTATRGTSFSGGSGGGNLGGAISYNGGGLIIIKANSINTIGSIISNGVNGEGMHVDKAGGGSGGGNIRIFSNIFLNDWNFSGISAKGGIGANKSYAKGRRWRRWNCYSKCFSR